MGRGSAQAQSVLYGTPRSRGGRPDALEQNIFVTGSLAEKVLAIIKENYKQTTYNEINKKTYPGRPLFSSEIIKRLKAEGQAVSTRTLAGVLGGLVKQGSIKSLSGQGIKLRYQVAESPFPMAIDE